MSLEKAADKALTAFAEAVGENAVGALLADRRGKIIASTFRSDLDAEKLARSSISISRYAKKLCEDLMMGAHELMIIKMEEKCLLIMSIVRNLIFLTVTSGYSPLGLIFIEAEKVKKAMMDVIRGT